MAQIHPEYGPSGLDPAEVAARSHGLAYVSLRGEYVGFSGDDHEDQVRVVEQDRSVPADLDRSSLKVAKAEQPLLFLGRRPLGRHHPSPSSWCAWASIRRE